MVEGILFQNLMVTIPMGEEMENKPYKFIPLEDEIIYEAEAQEVKIID